MMVLGLDVSQIFFPIARAKWNFYFRSGHTVGCTKLDIKQCTYWAEVAPNFIWNICIAQLNGCTRSQAIFEYERQEQKNISSSKITIKCRCLSNASSVNFFWSSSVLFVTYKMDKKKKKKRKIAKTNLMTNHERTNERNDNWLPGIPRKRRWKKSAIKKLIHTIDDRLIWQLVSGQKITVSKSAHGTR